MLSYHSPFTDLLHGSMIDTHKQWHYRARTSYGPLNLCVILLRQWIGLAHMRLNVLTTRRESTRSRKGVVQLSVDFISDLFVWTLWTMDYASDMCGYSDSWWIYWWYLVECIFVSYCDVLLSLCMLVKQVKLLQKIFVISSS
jgi:hypothetical protein